MKSDKEFSFNSGVIWDDNPWKIAINSKHESAYMQPCKHCVDVTKIGRLNSFTCPKVIIVENEGGHNSTGLCLDCVLEANEVITVSLP